MYFEYLLNESSRNKNKKYRNTKNIMMMEMFVLFIGTVNKFAYENLCEKINNIKKLIKKTSKVRT